MPARPLRLFDAVGVELEYMLVDRDTLDVRPVADALLTLLAGAQPPSDDTAASDYTAANDYEAPSDYEAGPITWSNELALHVIELKTSQPATKIRELPAQFETAIRDLRPALQQLNLRLLPTAMHPWMDPAAESVLWPHENREIYQAYDRIFGCKSHGWCNVQSVHLNLPFDGDDEFARLHTAVRLVLPILPALAASSPVTDGRLTGMLDTRMHHYAEHCQAVPSLIGQLIPEAVYDQASYRRQIFQPIGEDIRPLDLDRVLQLDFLNARGAIARFDRGSIELRVMDVQEYPGADVAICAAVVALVKSLVAQHRSSLSMQQKLTTKQLREVLDAVTIEAENAVIDDLVFLAALGAEPRPCRAGELWRQLLDGVRREDRSLSGLYAPLEIIGQHGTLATRIAAALGDSYSADDLRNVYDQLADCLDRGEPFQP